MGKVEIPAKKWISKSSPVPGKTRGVLNNIPDILVKVWGSGVKVQFGTPFWQGKVQFTIRQQLINGVAFVLLNSIYLYIIMSGH